MNFREWATYGMEHGWVSPPICYFHDGLEFDNEQTEEIDAGGDPCVWLIHIYDSDEQRAEIEEKHAAYKWRKIGYEREKK